MLTEALPMSAEELHAILVKSNTLGNRARARFIAALLAMEESRQFLHLGFSSILHYAEHHFGCHRSQTYEFLTVAKALRELPECGNAFRDGGLSWSALREIAKVARPDSERKWIEFARAHTMGQLQAEVKDAEKKGRTAPRTDGHGLPRLTSRLTFELEPEDSDIVWKALNKAAGEMGKSVGEERVSSKDALLYLARQLLDSDPAVGHGPTRVPRDAALHTILYHRCVDCGKAHLPTPEGPVEIPGEVVDRIESEARKVALDEPDVVAPATPPASTERDKPNTYTIVKKVMLRDGLTCSNPACRRRLGLHAHHIKFRSEGGRTTPSNEILVCACCHAGIHMGLLKLEGDPLTGLKWTPRSDELQPTIDQELREVSSIPEVHVVPAAPALGESTAVDSSMSSMEPDEGLVRALVKIGYTKDEARERILKGWQAASAGGRKPTEGEVLLAAMRA